MANTTSSPNMNMPIPVVSTDPGPDWATNVDSCLNIVDSHNHTTGQGVQITPDGININTNLPFNENNATTVRTVRFTPQGAALSGLTDVGCVYDVSGDLYYNDGSGNQVRITQGGAVAGSTGTITGLPSGTASASYAAGTFTWQSATNTPAAMAQGPTKIAQQVASGKGVTISANASQASDYSFTLPIALPTTFPAILQTDTSGNISVSLTINSSTQATTFTFNGSGGTISSKTLRFQRVGDWITIYFPGPITGTSGTGSTFMLSNSALPTWVRPLTIAQAGSSPDMLNNSSLQQSPGTIAVLTSGLIQIQRDAAATAWTNSSTCGPQTSFAFTYYIGTGS